MCRKIASSPTWLLHCLIAWPGVASCRRWWSGLLGRARSVQVEGDPVDHATFTGTILEGRYGARTVTMWDQGTHLTDSRTHWSHGQLPRASKRAIWSLYCLVKRSEPGSRSSTCAGKDEARRPWLFTTQQDAFAHPECPGGGNVWERRSPRSSPSPSPLQLAPQHVREPEAGGSPS
jgi:hypothetical protein